MTSILLPQYHYKYFVALILIISWKSTYGAPSSDDPIESILENEAKKLPLASFDSDTSLTQQADKSNSITKYKSSATGTFVFQRKDFDDKDKDVVVLQKDQDGLKSKTPDSIFVVLRKKTEKLPEDEYYTSVAFIRDGTASDTEGVIKIPSGNKVIEWDMWDDHFLESGNGKGNIAVFCLSTIITSCQFNVTEITAEENKNIPLPFYTPKNEAETKGESSIQIVSHLEGINVEKNYEFYRDLDLSRKSSGVKISGRALGGLWKGYSTADEGVNHILDDVNVGVGNTGGVPGAFWATISSGLCVLASVIGKNCKQGKVNDDTQNIRNAHVAASIAEVKEQERAAAEAQMAQMYPCPPGMPPPGAYYPPPPGRRKRQYPPPGYPPPGYPPPYGCPPPMMPPPGRKKRSENILDGSGRVERAVDSGILKVSNIHGWKTQFKTPTVAVVTSDSSDIFYGLGNCKPKTDAGHAGLAKATNSDQLIQFYLKVLRLDCLPFQKDVVEALLSKKILEVKDKEFRLNEAHEYIKMPKLAFAATLQLSVAFELSIFSQLYNELAAESKRPNPTSPDGSELSQSTFFLKQYAMKLIAESRLKLRRHYLHMTRNLLQVLKAVFAKIAQDNVKLSNCIACELDKKVNHNDKMIIQGLMEFIKFGLEPVDYTGESPDKAFKQFYIKNKNAIELLVKKMS